jgi:hypothetical protein
MKGPLVTTGGIAGLLLLALIVGAVVIPDRMLLFLEPVPVKCLLVGIFLILIIVLAVIVYWALQEPRTARVVLGLMRACLGIATGSVIAPVGTFGLHNVSIAVGGSVTFNATWSCFSWQVFCAFFTALLAACFAFVEYRSVKTYEYEHGLITHL